MRQEIIVITFEYPPIHSGGIAAVAKDKVDVFIKENIFVNLISPYEVKEKKELLSIYPLSSNNNLLNLILSIYYCLKIIKQRKIDFVYCLSGTYAGFAAWIAALIFKTKYFVMAHGAEFIRFKKNRIVKYLLKKIYNKSRRIFAVSNFTKKELIEFGVEEQNISVVFNGIRIDKFKRANKNEVDGIKNKYRIEEKNYILLTVSRLDQRKGHNTVIKAINMLAKKNKQFEDDCLYLIVGSGPEEENIRKAIIDNRLENNIKLCGFVSHKDLSVIYTLADLFVMPSVSIEENGNVEGFGIVFLEAAACGTPSIAGIAGGMSDAVLDGVTGFTVDGLNEALVADKINLLYNDRKKLKSLSVNAERIVKEKYSIDNIFKREWQIIEDQLRQAAIING